MNVAVQIYTLLADTHTVPTVCQSVDWPPEELSLSTIMYCTSVHTINPTTWTVPAGKEATE